LCFEGCEKLAHKFLHGADDHAAHSAKVADESVDLVALEKGKIKGAVRTDFVLSAEIVAIALGTVAEAPFMTRVYVLTGLSLLMTVGVYGLVGGIVKLDDLGALLSRRGGAQRAVGSAIVWVAPWLMKALSVIGTIAMFLVGGGILAHGLPFVHDWTHHASESLATVPGVGGVLATLLPTVIDLLIGVLAGSLILAVVMLVQKMRKPKPAA
jgi:predicted DNA repair protein MutK